MIDEGVMGNLATLQPMLSPMLWNSIATGKHAYKHGIHGFIEPDPNGGARPCTSYSRTARALWNIFTHEGLRSNVVNWWASHPAEPINGCVVSNAFLRRNPSTPRRGRFPSGAARYIQRKKPVYAPKRLIVFPNEIPGSALLPFCPRAREVNQDEDTRLESLAKMISETATTQAVATAMLEREPWDFTAVYFGGIDKFCHKFMTYHPPRMEKMSEADFELFNYVLTGAYRFHDMILERLLQLVGPDAIVILCSDHGFQSRELRPVAPPREPSGPAAWHRPFGIFVAKGPGIKKNECVFGAPSLLDIAPTILTLFGLPIGDDMDGRPLVEIFAETPEVKRIRSWQEVPGEFGEHQGEQHWTGEEADELMRQFVALGYIDDPGEDKQKQSEGAELEAKYNLARNYLWQMKADMAIPLLEEIVRRAGLGNCLYRPTCRSLQGSRLFAAIGSLCWKRRSPTSITRPM